MVMNCCWGLLSVCECGRAPAPARLGEFLAHPGSMQASYSFVGSLSTSQQLFRVRIRVDRACCDDSNPSPPRHFVSSSTSSPFLSVSRTNLTLSLCSYIAISRPARRLGARNDPPRSSGIVPGLPHASEGAARSGIVTGLPHIPIPLVPPQTLRDPPRG